MEPTWVAAAIAVGVVSLVVQRRGEAGRTAVWRGRAESCGLTDVEQNTGFFGTGDLSGRVGRHSVLIERFARGKSSRGTRVVVRGLSGALSLSTEGLVTRVQKAFGSLDVETGDPAFDSAFLVRGDTIAAAALLDAETRRLTRELYKGLIWDGPHRTRTIHISVELADGTLTAEFMDRDDGRDEPGDDTLRALVTLAQRLAPPDEPEERLAGIARGDPEPLVRGRALATLARERAHDSVTREAMTAALQDADDEVRLQAALWLGEAGRPALRSLAASVAAPDSCSARAIAGLGEHLTPDEARPLLDHALGAGRPQTGQAALAALARGGARAVDAIAKVLAGQEGEIAIAAARALGSTASAAAEAPLLDALERGPDGLREAAAVALGHVGTPSSVMPLRDVEARARGGLDRAAREAIVLIQSRISGATPGQLALSEGAAGQVSLSEDVSGRVAVARAPEDDPQVR
jgi:hypothetical protein